jgi:hypothetical protein
MLWHLHFYRKELKKLPKTKMPTKKTQYPDEFIVKHVQEPPLPSLAQLTAQSRVEQMLLRNKSSFREKFIKDKLQEAKRLIISTRSQFNRDAWDAKTKQLKGSQIPKLPTKKSKSKSSSTKDDKKITSPFVSFNLPWMPLKPILNPPVGDNPYRRKFNFMYDKSYRELVSGTIQE